MVPWFHESTCPLVTGRRYALSAAPVVYIHRTAERWRLMVVVAGLGRGNVGVNGIPMECPSPSHPSLAPPHPYLPLRTRLSIPYMHPVRYIPFPEAGGWRLELMSRWPRKPRNPRHATPRHATSQSCALFAVIVVGETIVASIWHQCALLPRARPRAHHSHHTYPSLAPPHSGLPLRTRLSIPSTVHTYHSWSSGDGLATHAPSQSSALHITVP